MPTITLNRKVFEKLVGKKLPTEKLKDRISMLGTDLEKVTDNEIIVEVFPNRPDMLSEQGFARAFSSFIGVKKGLRKYRVRESNEQVIVHPPIKDIRPFTACSIVKNLKFTDERIREIVQIQEKLHITYGRNRKRCAIGVYPLNKISLPIHYTAKKPSEIKFQPLDKEEELKADEILKLHPTGIEYAHLLKDAALFPIFHDSKNNILSMPPIINSETAGKITEDTKDVFVECSGHDLTVLKICLNIIVTALADMGGDIYSMKINYGSKQIITPNLTPRKIKIDSVYYNKLLGLNLSNSQIKSFLLRRGYDVQGSTIFIPAYRADILHQVDIVEDIAIAYGYENFKEKIPDVATIAEADSLENFKEKVITILLGLGFLETSTYHITSETIQNEKMNNKSPLIKLSNALSQEFTVIRSQMLPCLIQVLSENLHHEYPQNLCEIGRVFKEDKTTETGINENETLAIVIAHSNSDFSELKKVLSTLMSALSIKYLIKPTVHDSFIKGRVGDIIINKKELGYIGELHPQVLTNFNLEVPVAALELNINELFKLV